MAPRRNRLLLDVVQRNLYFQKLVMLYQLLVF